MLLKSTDIVTELFWDGANQFGGLLGMNLQRSFGLELMARFRLDRLLLMLLLMYREKERLRLSFMVTVPIQEKLGHNT